MNAAMFCWMNLDELMGEMYSLLPDTHREALMLLSY